ncbi:MAG: 8-amino-7-oxononanoate synthase [Candidatus Omnitrophica bacterium]|nr:8-amino-7-oxononanoate synthase [Candidatus Omnitrophota bacterium]
MTLASLQEELDDLSSRGLYRSCRKVEALEGGRIRVDGKWLIHLASNNYLGLAQHPRVIRAAKEALDRFGMGAGSARLIGGTFPEHEALEEELARFKQTEAAVLFPTGYMANLGVLTGLLKAGDLVIGDRLNHASLIDAARLSSATFRVYPHGDAQRLEKTLRLHRRGHRRALIVTEGVFSMDGDLAPLTELVSIARRYEAWLLVDDAHATGVFGQNGRGTLEHFRIPSGGILQMGTLSKGLGSLGGFLAGPREVIETLKNKARPFIYTTAPPPSCAAAALEALRIVKEEPQLRSKLWAHVKRWTRALKEIGLHLISEESPIVPIRVGANGDTMGLARALFEGGVYAPGIRPPTVPAGTARIRTSLTALHTEADLEEALAVFQGVTSGDV